MGIAVKLSDALLSDAKVASKALHRSVPGQIEHWARIGKIAEENPDLSYDMIRNILIANEEVQAGKLTPYEFDDE